ncbi:SGNH/GDSL hydrolase family protein [Nonomuraea turcica]|uniref:SGNH/GDSL hydrolase family protein n=1 Tax=Nonomuraea sp. G32 TaxID=3067274 RepID=UPI00273C2BB7|nr:SGNH/GDSL hydrolase family protein [Nonomuraea sp. G32]MDP4509494.1 GDSL-type esterase/lipase family protein [Nonomuraea sp. G32]
MRSLRLIAALSGLVMAVVTPGVAAAAPLTSTNRDGGVLTRVHTAGRVVVDGDSVKYSWPGVYFEGKFRGTGVGIVLNDAAADYDVQIDGTTAATLVTPGQTTHWVTGLRQGVHSVRVVKRSESPWATSEFGGLVAVPHGAILAGRVVRNRQIEFVGDSFTAGYGNMSTTRECTGDDVNRTTNADLSFGAIAARSLNADYQINAFSGRGMVRNYNGIEPQTNYRTYYDRALLNVEGDIWRNPGTWRPQLVVIGLGINDFSTAINPGEQWTLETLVTAYRTAYHGFLDKLRGQYGRDTILVVSATYMSNTAVFAETARQVVQERNSRGDDRVRFWYYPETDLDYGGCHWHPSLHDHQLIADQLSAYIDTLRLRW